MRLFNRYGWNKQFVKFIIRFKGYMFTELVWFKNDVQSHKKKSYDCDNIQWNYTFFSLPV